MLKHNRAGINLYIIALILLMLLFYIIPKSTDVMRNKSNEVTLSLYKDSINALSEQIFINAKLPSNIQYDAEHNTHIILDNDRYQLLAGQLHPADVCHALGFTNKPLSLHQSILSPDKQFKCSHRTKLSTIIERFNHHGTCQLEYSHANIGYFGQSAATLKGSC